MFDFLRRSHLPDKALILFRAGLLDKSCSELLEAHLLLCPTCQLQLEATLPSTVVPGPGRGHAWQRS
jgi:hypothetical protein